MLGAFGRHGGGGRGHGGRGGRGHHGGRGGRGWWGGGWNPWNWGVPYAYVDYDLPESDPQPTVIDTAPRIVAQVLETIQADSKLSTEDKIRISEQLLKILKKD